LRNIKFVFHIRLSCTNSNRGLIYFYKKLDPCAMTALWNLWYLCCLVDKFLSNEIFLFMYKIHISKLKICILCRYAIQIVYFIISAVENCIRILISYTITFLLNTHFFLGTVFYLFEIYSYCHIVFRYLLKINYIKNASSSTYYS